jgi:hypothetical protein
MIALLIVGFIIVGFVIITIIIIEIDFFAYIMSSKIDDNDVYEACIKSILLVQIFIGVLIALVIGGIITILNSFI